MPPLLLITTIANLFSAAVVTIAASREPTEQCGAGIVIDVVPLEVHPRLAAPCTAPKFIVIGVTTGIHHRASTHVRTADAQHGNGINLVMDAIGDFEDAAEFGSLAVLFVRRQLFFGQPEESRIQRLFLGRDVTAVILQPVGLDHLAAERRQLVSRAVDLILSDSEVGVDAAGGVKTQKAHIEISHTIPRCRPVG